VIYSHALVELARLCEVLHSADKQQHNLHASLILLYSVRPEIRPNAVRV